MFKKPVVPYQKPLLMFLIEPAREPIWVEVDESVPHSTQDLYYNQPFEDIPHDSCKLARRSSGYVINVKYLLHLLSECCCAHISVVGLLCSIG